MDLTTFVELFTWPLVSLALISLSAPLVGVFLYARGESFHGIVLPQLATFGVALGFALFPVLFGHSHGGASAFADPSRAYLFSWAGLATAAGLLALGRLSGSGPRDAGRASAHVAAVFALASGGTVIASQLSPEGGLQVAALLSGETLATGPGDAAMLLGVTALTAILVVRGWRDLTLAGMDPYFARSVGARPARWNRMLRGVTGLVVLVGAMTVGPLPLFALLVLPPLAARRVARSMRAFLVAAPLIGAAGALAGAALAFVADLPVGASVVAGCAFVAAAVALVKR